MYVSKNKCVCYKVTMDWKIKKGSIEGQNEDKVLIGTIFLSYMIQKKYESKIFNKP